ncbi:formyltransferase family protein [Vibrio mediterranei]|uniref:formyltransferase family protein n=1 Tax=Vibrio mediterranei TaxID=689 RepID=UPI0015E6C877|nr:formyltransferase family protein [Vibrio mediterranei]
MKVVYLGYLIPFADSLHANPRVTELILGYEPKLPKGVKLYEYFKDSHIEIIDATNVNMNHEIINACREADIVVVGAFSQILKSSIIDHCRGKILNFHPSKLPAYRGGHPIEHQLLDGVEEGGVTFHHIDNGVDSGSIIFQDSFPISCRMTYESFLKTAINVGRELLEQVVAIGPGNWPQVSVSIKGDYRRILHAKDAVISPNMTVIQAKRIINALGWRGWVTYRGKDEIQNISRLLNSNIKHNVPNKELSLSDGKITVEVANNE